MTLRSIIDGVGVRPYYIDGPEDDPNGVIWCADNQDILPKLPEKCVDLVLTDIPYGEVNRPTGGIQVFDKGDADIINFDLDVLLPLLDKTLKSACYIFCGFQQYSRIEKYYRTNGFSRRCLVWEKKQVAPTNGEYIYLNGIELCAFGRKPKATFNAFCKNTVFRADAGKSKWHPTEKPLELIEEFICDSSNPSDLILDPFAGSGTTGVAAKQLGRKYILVEISEKYCDIAVQRLSQGVMAL